jgi:hypothetical protein
MLTVRSMRCALVLGVAFVIVLTLAVAACAETTWPSALSYSVGVSSDETAKIQTSAAFSGPLNENFGAKIGGWWIAGGTENRAFVGDAYIDYHKRELYLAGGRKFVPFGQVGLLVSPGIEGGEVKVGSDRVTLQAIAGRLAFTPVTGGTRFTFAGNRGPADENIVAGRLAFQLTEPPSTVGATLGVNALDLMDDTGWSGDLVIDANKWLALFGESASFNSVDAHVYGLRLSNQQLVKDPAEYTMLVLYRRDVPIGFLPAQVGATQFFENQTGWAGGVYHQFDARYGLGLYADEDNAILTLFGYVPLR